MSRRLRIGFVTVWFERGQAYVTRALRDAVDGLHDTYIFARTASVLGKGAHLETRGDWDVANLTTHPNYQIPPDALLNWIRTSQLDAVVFNEEFDWNLIRAARTANVKVAGYLDFLADSWRPLLSLYDAVLCSTRRSHALVKDHCPAHYVGWGADTTRFFPINETRPFTFFHNAGWLGVNFRKMTPSVLIAFDVVSRYFPDLTLLVHAQSPMAELPREVAAVLHENSRIEYRVETLPAPGLYHLGQIFVFPTKLEGLGLPIIEAMACGMPVITTNAPPMNEFVRHQENGLLVEVASRQQRPDGISFPETIVDILDLALKMAGLANEPELIAKMGQRSAEMANGELNLAAFQQRVRDVLERMCPD